MIIYRYLTNEEVKYFSKGNTWALGARPTEEMLEHSRSYKPGVKYIHFFKKLDDLPKIQKLSSDPDGKFIGMFNMPMRFALAGKGIGEYFGKVEGGDSSQIKEFAVEAKALRFAEFVDYIFDEHCDLTVEEARDMFADLTQETSGKE